MIVDLDVVRLVAGLAVAVLLLVIAAVLVVTVDWSPPSEATRPPDGEPVPPGVTP